jgi:hypothetical protein
VDPREPFKGSWDRFDRAIAHRDEATKVWNDFISGEGEDDEPYSVSLYLDEEREGVGRATLRVWQNRPVPVILPILFGEYFYNLRAALDYAVYTTAVIDNHWQDPPPREKDLQFPICDSPESWRKNMFHVAPLNERHRSWIEQVQPYQGFEEGEVVDPRVRAIWWINYLARLDRHRELRVVGGYASERKPGVLVRTGVTIDWDQMGENIFVEDGAVTASFTVTPWAPGDEVEANPQTSISVDLKDFTTGDKRPADWLYAEMPLRLRLIESVIHSEVGRLEYDCVRRTRSEFVDTNWEGFKHPPDT